MRERLEKWSHILVIVTNVCVAAIFLVIATGESAYGGVLIFSFAAVAAWHCYRDRYVHNIIRE